MTFDYAPACEFHITDQSLDRGTDGIIVTASVVSAICFIGLALVLLKLILRSESSLGAG